MPIRRKAAIVGIVIVGMVTLLPWQAAPLSPETSGSSAPEWWGSKGINEGFHIRVPVTIRNPHEFALSNPPVIAQVDLTERLAAVGWPVTPSGSKETLKSFQFDLSSVRVVAMVNNEIRRPGSTDGRMHVVDSAFAEGDDRRYEVPSLLYPGRFTFGEEAASEFDSQTNPVVTVVWRIPGLLEPGTERHFMVYFDSHTNGDKNPARYASTYLAGQLQSAFWMGPGVELVGRVVPGQGNPGTVTVVGLQANTRISVSIAKEDGSFQPLASSPGFQNPFTLGQFQVATVRLTLGQAATFRIEADRPVVALSAPEGFVPSLDAGMAGREFVFGLYHPSAFDQDTVYFSAMGTEPTVIRVRRISDGREFEFHLNDETNPYPYSISPRAYTADEEGGCNPIGGPYTSPLLPSGSTFYAQVVRGSPVVLQVQPNAAAYQVPTRYGEPIGTDFWSAVGWTDQWLWNTARGPVCLDTTRQGVWFAAAHGSPARVNVTTHPDSTLARTVQVDPPGTDREPFPAGRAAGESPAGYTGPNPAPFRDRPLRFQATSPSWVFTGLDPRLSDITFGSAPPIRMVYESDVQPHLHGPLGGANGAREFSSLGPTLVYAPFEGTTLTVALQYLRSGVAMQIHEVGRGSFVEFQDRSPNDRLHGVRINATRPVLVIPLQASTGFLSGVPVPLDVTLGPAEFRGHLLEVTSRTGLDPLTGSTTPGTSIDYTLVVRNLGRDIDGPLRDTVDLKVSSATSGWQVSLDRATVQLEGGGSAEVRLTITPPSDAPSGTAGFAVIQGKSRGNPLITDTLGTVTYIKRSFDVRIWFDVLNGPKHETRVAQPGVEAEYRVFVQNRGSVTDSIALEVTAPEPGWEILLLKDSQEIKNLVLKSLEAASLRLVVRTPSATGESILFTTVTASSQASPAVLDRIVATTKITAPFDIRIEAPTTHRAVGPGEPAVFPLYLTNVGSGSAELRLEISTDVSTSWEPAELYLEDPASGQRVPINRITLGPNERLPLIASLTPRENASASVSATVRLAAKPEDASGDAETFLFVTVKPVHRLAIQAPKPPPFAAGGGNLTQALRLTNQGNLDEHLTTRITESPLGWGIDLPVELTLPRNATQGLALHLFIPPTVPSGTYNLTVSLVSEDGTVFPISLPISVGHTTRGETGVTGIHTARPGATAYGTIPFTNSGNVPVRVQVIATAGDRWRLAEFPPLVVQPGAGTDVQFGWLVPADEPDGNSTHSLTLRTQSLGPDAGELEQSFTVAVEIRRPNLLISRVRTFPGPAGTLVNVELRNDGERPAVNSTVSLVSSNRVIDTVSVDELAPLGSANVTLLLPRGETGDSVVVVDLPNLIVERDEQDNSAQVASVANGGKTPSLVGAWAVLAGLLAGMARGAQRRIRE